MPPYSSSPYGSINGPEQPCPNKAILMPCSLKYPLTDQRCTGGIEKDAFFRRNEMGQCYIVDSNCEPGRVVQYRLRAEYE